MRRLLAGLRFLLTCTRSHTSRNQRTRHIKHQSRCKHVKNQLSAAGCCVPALPPSSHGSLLLAAAAAAAAPHIQQVGGFFPFLIFFFLSFAQYKKKINKKIRIGVAFVKRGPFRDEPALTTQPRKKGRENQAKWKGEDEIRLQRSISLLISLCSGVRARARVCVRVCV